MVAVVAPIDMPFVVSAEPTSNKASVKDTPIVVKITAKITNVKMRRTIDTVAVEFSRVLVSAFMIGSSLTFSLAKISLMLRPTDFPKAISLEMRMPPAIEKVHPPTIISTMNIDRTVLFCAGMLM